MKTLYKGDLLYLKNIIRRDLMKVFYSFLLLLGLSIIAGCQNNQENTMVLLDEKVKEINISKSSGVGDMNQDILLSIKDRKSINIFIEA